MDDAAGAGADAGAGATGEDDGLTVYGTALTHLYLEFSNSSEIVPTITNF